MKTPKENSKSNMFRSIKNNCEFEYKLDAERQIMLLCEFDTTIDSYKPFEFKMVGIKDMEEIDSFPGFIMNSDDSRDFVLVSDELLENKKLIKQISSILQSREENQITLSVGGLNNLDSDLMIENVAFLYEFALEPLHLNTFSKIQETLDFIVETTLGELKRCIKNDTAIYQLMFHQAIKADLTNHKISDETIVYPSPLINSIIRRFENK